MNEKLKEKIHESLSSVLPITLIVLILSVVLVPLEIGTVALFLMGAVLLIVGMGFFQLGAEISMTPLGQGVGSRIFKNNSVVIIIAICFLMGAVITISEPDLQVLANQVASIPNEVLIWTVALGVGIFTAIAVVRILFHISLAKMLTVFYILLFLLSFFTPSDFVAVRPDDRPLHPGVGCRSFRRPQRQGQRQRQLRLCRAVQRRTHPDGAAAGHLLPPFRGNLHHSGGPHHPDLLRCGASIPGGHPEVLVSMLPVIGVFVIFQLLTRNYRKRQVLRMSIGFLYTYVGLVLFLTGVNIGFAPVGSLFGSGLAESSFRWLLVPIGIVIGYYIVKAEPAVQVLNEQVEEITGGTVSHKMMNAALSIGVACAVALAMVRVLTGLNIYWIIIPGYIISLIFSHFVPPVFVGIAFDSGGVASGPMTSTFLLPLAIGACTAIGGNVVTDAFGIVALVALAPLIAIQIMGLIYAHKAKSVPQPSQQLSDDTVVELEEE